MRIDAIKVDGRFRKDLGDLDSLASSIEARGLIHPPTVDPDLRLLAGRRRIEAMRNLGWTHVEVYVVDRIEDAAERLRVELEENTCRKAMTASEQYALGKRIEELERPKAEARQESTRLAGRSPDGEPVRSGSAEPDRTTNPTAHAVGDAIGTSSAQWKRLKHIGDRAAEGDEAAVQTLERIDQGEESVAGGYRKLRQADITDAPTKPTNDSDGRVKLPAAKRAEQIADLASRGYRASQIAERLGVGVEHVRKLARDHGIALPDDVIGKTRKHDSNRIIVETVASLEGIALGLDLIEVDQIDASQADEWATSLSASLATIKKLATTLKKLATNPEGDGP